MKALAQSEIIALITDLNAFADSAETLINTTQTNYDKDKRLLLNRHSSALSTLDSTYKANCASVQNKSKQTISDAKKILAEITKLDEKLSSVDKYYVKTKKKKEELLSDTTSDAYEDATDYFKTLGKIKESFTVLFKKYSEDILPGLINGLNYLFSSQRKKDYEELIILRNTVAAFVKEIEEMLPPLTEENLATLKEEYFTQRGRTVERQKNELATFENNHLATLDKVADKICTDLDSILPDEFVEYLFAIMANYSNVVHKVNASNDIQDEVLNMCYVDYPVDFFVQSKIVASIIKEKCSKLLVDGAIRLPIMMSTRNAPVWMITNDNSNSTAVQAFTHSIMYGLLSSCPVEKLTYTIVDPENRGNSISPFFDAKKKLPELFGERIYISKDEVAAKVSKLNEKIENILQDRLGNQYDNIFDYAKNTPDYNLNVEFIMLYDFPRGFDERILAELRNVLRNGSKCGIYTVISYLPDPDNTRSREYQQSLQSIIDLSTVINQNGENFVLRGLPLVYYTMPEKIEFAKFFSKYMLIFEGIINRGIAFSPLIRKLIEAKDSMELDSHIEQICEMMKNYEKAYAKVPEINSVFPSLVTLGNVLYPADVFSDSVGYQHIVDKFGTERNADIENTSFVELPLTFDLRNSFNLFLNCPEASSKGMLDFTHHVIWSFLSFIPVTKVNVCVFDSEQRGNSIIPFLDFRKRSPEIFDQKIYTSQEQMYDRLQKINAQIDEFIQEKLGNRYKDILDYNLNTPNRAEPVTLLVLYDFPSGMDGRSIDLLTNILRNGNKCGVFTMICYNPNITFSRYESIDERLEQISRYCASIDYKDGHYSLLPYNLQINTAVMNLDYTEQSNIGFRAAYCDDATQKYYLDLISKTYAEQPSTLQTFEGSRTTNLIDYFADTNIGATSELPAQIHMGTLIKVAPPFAICIDKKKKHNLLVCGSNERMANTISNNYMISALLNRNTTVYCIDGDKLVGDDGSADFYDTLGECSTRFKVAQDRADIIKFINEVYQNYQSWKKQNSDDVIFVVIKNLQFLDIVKSMFKGDVIDESEFIDEVSAEPEFNPADPFAAVNNMFANRGSDDNMSVGEKLIKMIEDGSGFGIHFVVTSLEYQSVRECMYYGENILTKFPERIIFSLGSNDADNLIENVSVAGLRDNTVYFTDGVKNTFQMKPYITPSTSELKKLFN